MKAALERRLRARTLNINCIGALGKCSPSKNLVILSNFLPDSEFADGLKSNSHGLGLCLQVQCSLLSSVLFSLNVPATMQIQLIGSCDLQQ